MGEKRLKNFANRCLQLSNHGTIESRAALGAALRTLSPERLRELCGRLSSYGGAGEEDATLREALTSYHEKRSGMLEVVQGMALYPTEEVRERGKNWGGGFGIWFLGVVEIFG